MDDTNTGTATVPVPEVSLSLAARVAAVRAELAALQREVEELERTDPFLGSFHAVNGLRQAGTYVTDCLVRLPESAGRAG